MFVYRRTHYAVKSLACYRHAHHVSNSRLRLRRSARKLQQVVEEPRQSQDPYLFHPLVRTIQPVNQALRLTKTVLHEDVFPIDSGLQGIPFDEILPQIYRSIDSHQTEDLESKNLQRSKGFFTNVIKAVWSSALSYPGLLRQTMAYQPSLKVHWERFGFNLQVSGRTGILFSSKEPLANFALLSEVNKTAEIPASWKEEIISPVFELSQNSSRTMLDSGFLNDVYPFPHTLVLAEGNWNLPHLIAQGIMFSFGRLLERCISINKAQFGETLEYPLSLRTVVFNHNKMALLCYQLNTLKFEDDEGVKNQMWLKSDIPIAGGTKNEENIKALVALLLYGENGETTGRVACNLHA